MNPAQGERSLAYSTAEDSLARPASPWSSLAWAALVLGALLGAIYWGILRDLVWQWWDDANYSHGFLVPLFSAFLTWQRRRELAALPVRGSAAGLLVLLAGAALLLLGEIGAELFLRRLSLIVIITGLILFHLGRQWLRALALPLAFLLFMVPLPATLFYAIAFPLQKLAADNAVAILDLLGVPVLAEGNVIHLSRLSLGVTEACSGVRSLISLLALAVGWGYLMRGGPWTIALLAFLAVPITIVANSLRVVSTGLVGEWFGARYAEGFFHAFSGWLIFLVAFACLLGVSGLIRLAQARRGRSA